MDGESTVGGPLPVLFHMLWRHGLAVDLSVPLHSKATVTTMAAGGAA